MHQFRRLLNNLLKKDSWFIWSKQCRKAFINNFSSCISFGRPSKSCCSHIKNTHANGTKLQSNRERRARFSVCSNRISPHATESSFQTPDRSSTASEDLRIQEGNSTTYRQLTPEMGTYTTTIRFHCRITFALKNWLFFSCSDKKKLRQITAFDKFPMEGSPGTFSLFSRWQLPLELLVAKGRLPSGNGLSFDALVV